MAASFPSTNDWQKGRGTGGCERTARVSMFPRERSAVWVVGKQEKEGKKGRRREGEEDRVGLEAAELDSAHHRDQDHRVCRLSPRHRCEKFAEDSQ